MISGGAAVQTSLKPWRLDKPLPKLAPLQGKPECPGLLPDSLSLSRLEVFATSKPWGKAGKVVFRFAGINAFPSCSFEAASSDIFMVKSGIFNPPSFEHYRIEARNVKKRGPSLLFRHPSTGVGGVP
jgi:hypothetical protein